MSERSKRMREIMLSDMSEEKARHLLIRIHEILWPDDDETHEWSSDTFEDIAGAFSHARLNPDWNS